LVVFFVFFSMFHGYFDENDTHMNIALSADFAISTPLMGDFYSENEDVHRGLTMGAVDFMSMLEPGPPGFQGDSCPALNKHDARDEQAQFLSGDVPPALPVDPYFRLEGTTVIVENLSPEQIGNGLLNLLRHEAAASITKMSRIKFTVKAFVHVDGLSCDVKVRVYRQQLGFAVEFQRRSGDTLAFQGLFRLASEHLDYYSRVAGNEQHTFASANRSMVMQVPTAVRQEGFSKQEFSIAPLLEMARGTSDVGLQSEVAEALAGYASDANLLWQLGTPDALEVRENLSLVDHVSVTHPMRRLAAALAHIAEPNVSLCNEGGDNCIFPAVGVLGSALAPPPPPLMRGLL